MGFFNPSSWQGTGPIKSSLSKCGKCGLSKGCFSPKMEPTGKGKRKVLFVAEAPGEQEDRNGVQLVGKAGKFLRKVLREIGVELDDCTKTNAVICRPPNNQIDSIHIESCRPNLLKTIKQIAPNVIILLGGSAVSSLLAEEWKKGVGPISQWVGWSIPSQAHIAWVCPTYHPSFILRKREDPALVKVFKEHLQKAFKLEKVKVPQTSTKELEAQIECVFTLREARLRLRDLAKKQGLLAFDYETTGLKPENPKQAIVSCSFCLEGKNPWAFEMDESLYKYVSPILLSKKLKKIASNLKFEERWTRNKLGHGVVGWHFDTMLGAHYLDNRSGITSIKFQSYVLLGVEDYSSQISPYLKSKQASEFNRIREIDLRDLLVYNGMDSLLEFLVAEKQMEMIAS